MATDPPARPAASHDLTLTHATTESAWEAAAVQRLKTAAAKLPAPTRQLPQPLTERYTLEELLGEGSFGSVYKATDGTLNRSVAIKTIKASATDINADDFRTEAEAAARVEHLNVVRIYDWHTSADDTFLVMELVEGRSLRQWRLGRDEVDLREAVTLVLSAVHGLQAAHQAGLVHRDIKSANILVSDKDQTVRLTDFGLALPQEADSSGVAGSLRYMSPEHLDPASEVDERSDVYGMGVVLFEMLTGTRPFEGTATAIQEQILLREPPSATERNSKVETDLATITDKCLRKNPADRYQSATQLQQDLTAWLEGRPIAARPVGRLGRLYRWARREPLVAGLSSVLLFGLLAAMILGGLSVAEIIRQRDRAQESAEFANTQTDHFLNVVDLLVTNITDKLSEVPGASDLRQEVLQTAIQELVQASDDLQRVPEASGRMVTAHLKLANIFLSVGESRRAKEEFSRALNFIQAFTATSPEATDATEPTDAFVQLYLTYTALAEFALTAEQDLEKAAEYYRSAIEVSGHIRGLPSIEARLGTICALARVERFSDNLPQAVKLYETALFDAVRYLSRQSIEGATVAAIREPLAECLSMTGDTQQAVDQMEEALLIRRADFANATPDSEIHLIDALVTTGRVLLLNGQPATALPHLFEAHELVLARCRKFPENLDNPRRAASGCDAIGQAWQRCGNHRMASAWYERSVDFNEQLQQADPDNAEYQQNLMAALYHQGLAHFNDLQLDKAEQLLSQAIEVLAQLPANHTAKGWSGDIANYLQSVQTVEEATPADVSPPAIQYAANVLAARMRTLATAADFSTLQQFRDAIDATLPELPPADHVKAASILAATVMALNGTENPLGPADLPDDVAAVRDDLRDRAVAILLQLEENGTLSTEQPAAMLHADPYLEALISSEEFIDLQQRTLDPLPGVELLPEIPKYTEFLK